MKQQRTTKEVKDEKKIRQTQIRDEVLRLYVNGKSLDDLELSDKQQLLVSDIARYWLIKHGYSLIRLNQHEHYGWYAVIGIIGGLLLMLILLYYLPI